MSSPRTYPTHQGIEYFVNIKNRQTGALADPSGDVTLTLEGDGITGEQLFTFGVDSQLEKVATGRYRLTRASPVGGRVYWKWRTTGDLEGSLEGYDFIEPGHFT